MVRWGEAMHHDDDDTADLFLDAPGGVVALRDSRSLLEFPFFGLHRTAGHDPIEFKLGEVSLRVTGGEKGIATIWDRDLLIYAASIINKAVDAGETPHRRIRFVAHDFLRNAKRGTGKRAYQQLGDALVRLNTTHIVTSIEAGDQAERRGFHWIDSFKENTIITRSGEKRLSNIEITMNDWLFRGLVQDRSVLGISPAYFELQGGLERRLYQIARKHCGKQKSWRFSLGKLRAKVGSTQEMRHFKRDLAKVIAADNIPTYTFRIEAETEYDTSVSRSNRALRKRTDDLIVTIIRREGKHIPGRLLRRLDAALADDEFSVDEGSAFLVGDDESDVLIAREEPAWEDEE